MRMHRRARTAPTPTLPREVPAMCETNTFDKSAEYKDTKVHKEEADYIVVGSGPGGGPLAARLAEAGYEVLLIDAGDDPVKVAETDYTIPAFHTLSSENKEISWKFMVDHYEKNQQRDPKFVDSKDEEQRGIFYPRASALGGCSSHNAMITVYGVDKDWTELATMTKDDSFNADNMRAYFERLENCQHRTVNRIVTGVADAFRSTGNSILNFFRRKPVASVSPGSSSGHGYEGWLKTSTADPKLILDDPAALLNLISSPTRQEGLLPINLNLDPNDKAFTATGSDGLFLIPVNVDNNGQRSAVRERVLDAVQRTTDSKSKQSKLRLKLNTFVTNILFNGDETSKQAVGVKYVEGKHLYHASPLRSSDNAQQTTTGYAFARREVIIAAGAFNTPQLLMLSGIGDQTELSKHNIKARANLPVGKNLQDRIEVVVEGTLKKPLHLLEDCTFQGDSNDPCFQKWKNREGPYATNGGLLGVLRKAKKGPQYMFMFVVPSDFQGYKPGYSERIKTAKDQITWAVLIARTQNRNGAVTLRSPDPFHTPHINFRYFEEGNDPDGTDLDAAVEGLQHVLKYAEGSSDAIKSVNAPTTSQRKNLAEYVKNTAWGHHACCTASIGAVLNNLFQVVGIDRLRVVDASVFPKIPGFFIATPIYQISEKAADVILASVKSCPRSGGR